jgi:hypothetical protein
MKYLYIFIITLYIPFSSLFAANELFVKGPGSNTATATLINNGGLVFVNGEIINSDGLLVNKAGAIELTGNWTNTQTNNKYQSSGAEKFYGTAQQTISGTMNGTTNASGLYDNQFYNLKVYRNSGITAIPAKYLTIASNVNVANSIDFEASTPNATIAGTGTNQAVIRTDPSSPSNVGSYTYEIYLQNPSASALTNYAALSGNGHIQYIEGKLRRQVNAADTYDFPIGFAPGTKDGMEGYSLKFNNAPTSKSILAYIENGTQAPLYRNVVCDVGKDPGPGGDPFPNCIGAPDGIRDLYYLDATDDLSHQWKATASDAVGTINYDITLYPGANLDPLSNYYTIPAACGSPYQGNLLRVIAKDGVVGGTSQYGMNYYFPFGTIQSYLWCGFSNNAPAIGLYGQTSFSTFRIHGTPNGSLTVLPVELTAFTITPINNTFFRLNWNTASELNNYGYDIERSVGNNGNFEKIGFVSGNGTTYLPHDYIFDDHNVTVETNYYYRLKILDTNGKYTYSNVLSGRLKGTDFMVSDFYPNPTEGNVQLNVFIPKEGNLQTTVYDVLGQTVKQEIHTVTKGINKVEYNFSALAKAGYMVSFVYDNQTIIKKLIKQ